MIDNTINDDKTIAGGGEGAILAGRYRPGLFLCYAIKLKNKKILNDKRRLE